MKEVYNSCDLTDREKLLLFYLLNPSLKPYLKDKGVFVEDAYMILSVIGEDRLEDICEELNNTVFDTDFIKGLKDAHTDRNGR